MQSGKERPEEVAQEELVRSETDAVAHPRTVVIHTHDALTADAAVVCPRRLRHLALLTVSEVQE